MQLIVHDRRTVERDIAARTPHILVSIRDPDKRPVRPRRNAALREALFLDFHDAEPVRGFRVPPDIRLMQALEAVRIWEFVQRHRDGIDTIVCHCEQGMSRSPAVAIALAEAMGGVAEGILAESQPNQYVYELLSETIQHLTEKGATMTVSQLPYGVGDLDPDVVVHPDDRDLVRCYVRGCRHFVRRPTRRRRGELCPEHGIYCHHSRYGSTYSYADVRRNIIASPDLFAQRIVGHPFKYESHRLGSENSEDALSWNVFRSLQEAGCLAQVAKLLIGEDHEDEPRLYMWGIRVDDDSFEPWDLLIAARERFESNLPIKRPLTEPDIALHLPGKYLVLIEAKFTSPNPVYRRGPRKDEQSLTLDELLDIYWDPSLRILNYTHARSQNRIHYQLWRNMVFAEWMAKLESERTTAYHVNLLRSGQGKEDWKQFSRTLHDDCRVCFRLKTWEAICTDQTRRDEERACVRYLLTKSCHLRQAFRIGHASQSSSAIAADGGQSVPGK